MLSKRAAHNDKKFSQDRKTLVFLLDWINTSYHSSILAGVTEAAVERDVNLLIFVTGRLHSNSEWEKCRNVLFDFIERSMADGLLVLAPSIGNIVGMESVADLLKNYAGIPIVTTGEKFPDYPCVSIDNTKGMSILLEHLIEVHGYKRIAFITGPEGNSESEMRFKTYRDILKKYNIPLNPSLVVPGNFMIASGKTAVKTLIDERKVKFDVIVASNDTMALGVIEELRGRKIQVPEEIPVVGFDDAEISQYANLTTIHQPFDNLGKIALTILDQYTDGDAVEPVTYLTPQLIIRQSCGCFTARPTNSTTSRQPVIDQNFETFFIENRERVIADISKAKLTDDSKELTLTRWTKKILDAFFEEISGKSSTAFIQIWNKVIFWAIADKINLTIVRNIFSIIKWNILSIQMDNKVSGYVIGLFEQVEGMIEEALKRDKVFNKILFDYELEETSYVGERILASLEVADELNVAFEEFPGFGIKRCYLSLYDEPENPLKLSSLIFAYDEHERYALPKEGKKFPTRELLPREYFNINERFTFLIEDLFQGYDQIGFILFDFGVREYKTFELLRHKLSVGLKGARLIERIRNQALHLEEEVIARTADLSLTNSQLQREILERKKAEESLKRSEERFREMALLLPTIVIETDINLRIQFINKSGFETLEITENELRPDTTLIDFIYPDDRNRFQEYVDRLLQGAYPNFREFRLVKKEGAFFTLMCKASPNYKNHIVEGIRWNAIDIKPLMSSVILPEDSFFKEHNFSPREKEVLLLMLQGHKIKDIAKKLFITESTVKGHISAIYSEIGVKSRTEFFQTLEEYQINHFGYQSFIFSLLSKLIKD